jgi:methionyl-tRNA formyltransferase
MKIVFMGTPEFSVTILQKLIDAGHGIDLVVSQPDRRQGRGKKFHKPPVAEYASLHGLDLIQPEKVKDQAFIDRIIECHADCAVVAAYGRILPLEVLNAPKFGCINVHASLLPQYRGAAPIQWAIRNGDKTVGVSIMKLSEGMDEGPVFSRDAFPMDFSWNKGDLFAQMAERGGNLLVNTLARIENDDLQPEAQDSQMATYAPMFHKEDAHTDFSGHAEALERLNRALMPDESVYTFWQGKRLALRQLEVVDLDKQHVNFGTVLQADKSGFVVACGQGAVKATVVQPEGKKAMPAAAFLNGSHIAAGDHFDI